MSNPLSDAWGDFLSQYRWDWFVTLTFEGDVKTFTAHRRCNVWLRSLEKAAGQPIAWFRGDEFGEKFGKFHMHLLIANVAHLHRFTWMKQWKDRNGFARIFEFDPSKGATYYIAKYVTKQFGEWDLSDKIEAFLIQQPVLPLIGQRGSPNICGTRARAQRRPTRRKLLQVAIEDYKEPDLSQVDPDPIRASFHLQTSRRRR